MKKIIITIAFLFICTGAVQANEEPLHFIFNEPFTLGVLQTAQSEDGNVSVQFLEITEDSLCPEDAQCIWAGTVIINVSVKEGENEEIIPLELRSTSGMDQIKIEFLSFNKGAVTLKVFRGGDQGEENAQNEVEQ